MVDHLCQRFDPPDREEANKGLFCGARVNPLTFTESALNSYPLYDQELLNELVMDIFREGEISYIGIYSFLHVC